MERKERIQNMDTWEFFPEMILNFNQQVQESEAKTLIGSLHLMNAALMFYAKHNDIGGAQIIIEPYVKNDVGGMDPIETVTVTVSQPLQEDAIKEELSKTLSTYIRQHSRLRKEYRAYRQQCQDKVKASVRSILVSRGLKAMHIFKTTNLEDEELRKVFNKLKTPEEYDEFFYSLPDADLPPASQWDSWDKILGYYEKLVPGCQVYGCVNGYIDSNGHFGCDEWAIVNFYRENSGYSWIRIHQLADTVNIWVDFNNHMIEIPLDISHGKTYTDVQVERMIEKRIVDESDYECNLSELRSMGIVRNDDTATAGQITGFDRRLNAAIQNAEGLSEKDSHMLNCLRKAYQAPDSEKIYWYDRMLTILF